MIKVIVCGALGKMGRAVIEEIGADSELELVGAVEAADNAGLGAKVSGVEVKSRLFDSISSCDVVVDFTNPRAALEHIHESAAAGKAAVVGTTGFTSEELSVAKKAAAWIPIIISPNMSAGVKAIGRVRPSAHLVHGREGLVGARKSEEIGMHSLRGGDVVGEHTVIFAGEGERFELTHRAHSRRTLARGTLRAIHFIHGKEPGIYTMADVLGL